MWVGDPKVVGLNSKRGDSLAACHCYALEQGI